MASSRDVGRHRRVPALQAAISFAVSPLKFQRCVADMMNSTGDNIANQLIKAHRRNVPNKSEPHPGMCRIDVAAQAGNAGDAADEPAKQFLKMCRRALRECQFEWTVVNIMSNRYPGSARAMNRPPQ